MGSACTPAFLHMKVSSLHSFLCAPLTTKATEGTQQRQQQDLLRAAGSSCTNFPLQMQKLQIPGARGQPSAPCPTSGPCGRVPGAILTLHGEFGSRLVHSWGQEQWDRSSIGIQVTVLSACTEAVSPPGASCRAPGEVRASRMGSLSLICLTQRLRRVLSPR